MTNTLLHIIVPVGMQLEDAVRQLKQRFSLRNIYATPGLMDQFLHSSNKIDLLEDPCVKQLSVPLLDLYRALHDDPSLHISEDFVLSVEGFNSAAYQTKFQAYCFGLSEDELSAALFTMDSKFCYQPCKVAFFESESALRQFLTRFAREGLNFPISGKAVVIDPNSLTPRFASIYRIPKPIISRRTFRIKRFGEISQIFEEGQDWYVRMRNGVVLEGGEPVDSAKIQRAMLNQLFDECRQQMRREHNNRIRKELKQSRPARRRPKPTPGDTRKKQFKPRPGFRRRQ